MAILAALVESEIIHESVLGIFVKRDARDLFFDYAGFCQESKRNHSAPPLLEAPMKTSTAASGDFQGLQRRQRQLPFAPPHSAFYTMTDNENFTTSSHGKFTRLVRSRCSRSTTKKVLSFQRSQKIADGETIFPRVVMCFGKYNSE